MRMLEDRLQPMGLRTVDQLPETMMVSKRTPVPDDYLIVIPEITTDPDTDLVNHQTNMSIYERSSGNLSSEFFIYPEFYITVTITYESYDMDLELPVFQPILPVEPSQEQLETYFTSFFSSVLSKGDADTVYKLLTEIDTEAFFEGESLKMAILPGRRESTLETVMSLLPPGTSNLYNIIKLRSRMHQKSIPLPIVESVLTDLQYVWELPQEKEVISYSLDRIPKTDSNCQPVDQKGGNFLETTPGKAKKYVRIGDVPETFNDSGELATDVFTVFVVYLEPEDDKLVLKVAFARVNFAEIGSKHAHVVVNMLPEKFHYVFSGEMIIENGVFSYNLNSGMFYHLHKAPGMKRNFTQEPASVVMSSQSDEYNYVRGFLFSNTLHWEEFSKVVMESLLERQLVLKGNLRRPKMLLNEKQLSEYCTRRNFSFRVYSSKKACEGDSSGIDMCK